jgi:hypothetical protein
MQNDSRSCALAGSMLKKPVDSRMVLRPHGDEPRCNDQRIQGRAHSQHLQPAGPRMLTKGQQKCEQEPPDDSGEWMNQKHQTYSSEQQRPGGHGMRPAPHQQNGDQQAERRQLRPIGVERNHPCRQDGSKQQRGADALPSTRHRQAKAVIEQEDSSGRERQVIEGINRSCATEQRSSHTEQ